MARKKDSKKVENVENVAPLDTSVNTVKAAKSGKSSSSSASTINPDDALNSIHQLDHVHQEIVSPFFIKIWINFEHNFNF